MRRVTTTNEDITGHKEETKKDADIVLVQMGRPTDISDTIKVRRSIDATDKAPCS